MSETYAQIAHSVHEDPVFTDSLPPVADIPRGQDELWEQANRYRPELYGLLAVAISSATKDLISRRALYPSHGMVDFEGNTIPTIEGSLEGLELGLDLTIFTQLPDILNSYYSSDLAPVMRRIDTILPTFEALRLDDDKDSRYESASVLIGGGMRTAVQEIPSGLAAVSRVVRSARPNATKEEIIKIARNSKTLPVKLASINVTQLDAASTVMHESAKSAPGDGGLASSLMLKVNASGDEYVDFAQPIPETATAGSNGKRAIKDIWSPIHFKTLGCPALARLDGDSAIVDIWNWAIDICEQENVFELGRVYTIDLPKQGRLVLEPAA